METILVVDDEQQMQHLIELFLKNEGYHVLTASSAQEAEMLIQQHDIQLILLDIMMPFMDGFTFGQQVMQYYHIPIIFLTALETKEHKLKGLTMGAEDYIVKPFDASELIARIRIVLRRGQRPLQPESKVVSNDIVLDKASRQVWVRDTLVTLTLKEFELLTVFLARPQHVFSREELLQIVWGIEYNGSGRTVDTHIKTLRIKLNKGGDGVGEHIQTVWGIGYRYEPRG